MKNVCGLVFLLILASCGNKTKKVENPYDDSGLKHRVTDLEARVSALEFSRVNMINSINASQTQIDGLTNVQATMASDLVNLDVSVSALQSLTESQISELSSRMDAVESAVISLSAQDVATSAQIEATNITLDNLTIYVNYLVELGVVEDSFLRGDISDLQASIAATGLTDFQQSSQISFLQAQMTSSQTMANSFLAQLLTLQASVLGLQSNVNIVQIVDPCGDGVGFDEVFFKMSNGKYVASFSENASGLNTRFSILTPGSFVTTDGTNCHFNVDNAGVIHW